jgi:hypothetical protein
VTRLLKQPNKLMAKLNLSVDDQDMCHVRLTFYTLDRSTNHHLPLISSRRHLG